MWQQLLEILTPCRFLFGVCQKDSQSHRGCTCCYTDCDSVGSIMPHHMLQQCCLTNAAATAVLHSDVHYCGATTLVILQASARRSCCLHDCRVHPTHSNRKHSTVPGLQPALGSTAQRGVVSHTLRKSLQIVLNLLKPGWVHASTGPLLRPVPERHVQRRVLGLPHVQGVAGKRLHRKEQPKQLTCYVIYTIYVLRLLYGCRSRWLRHSSAAVELNSSFASAVDLY